MPQGLSDFQINALAESVFQELAKNVSPTEGIAILGTAFLMIYERCGWDPRPSIEKYCDDIRDGLLTTWKMRTMPAPSTDRMQ